MAIKKLIFLINIIINQLSVVPKRIFLKEILVLGDSHAVVFNHRLFKRNFHGYFFNTVSISGATVSGLENPNSKTQALPIFQLKLKHTKAKKVIVLLGEVDAGFLIWYRAEKYNTDVDTMIKSVAKIYCNFLDEIAQTFETICISAPLPTIQDGNDWGGVANARKEVKATQFERTQLTLQFNQLIEAHCTQKGISYLMLDQKSLGKDGLITKELLNEDPNDHHYELDKYALLIIDKLKTTA